MRKTNKYKYLLEDIEKSLEDPIYGVCQNYSLDKCEDYYNKHVMEWGAGICIWNPAAAYEVEIIEMNDVCDIASAGRQAANLVASLKDAPFFKEVWYSVKQNEIVVHWFRLKTFDEWLEKGIKDALKDTYEDKYSNAKILLANQEKEWFEWRNIEEDIKEVKRILYDRAEDPKEEKTVTVLQLKI